MADFKKMGAAFKSLFGAKAAEPVAPPPQDLRKEKELARLKNYLAEITTDLAEILKKPLTEDSVHALSYDNHIDVSLFTAADLKAIAPEYEALHDLCLKHNVRLDLEGFDILPKQTYASDSVWSVTPFITITADRSRTYDGFRHPRYNGRAANGFAAVRSVKKDLSAGPA